MNTNINLANRIKYIFGVFSSRITCAKCFCYTDNNWLVCFIVLKKSLCEMVLSCYQRDCRIRTLTRSRIISCWSASRHVPRNGKPCLCNQFRWRHLYVAEERGSQTHLSHPSEQYFKPLKKSRSTHDETSRLDILKDSGCLKYSWHSLDRHTRHWVARIKSGSEGEAQFGN